MSAPAPVGGVAAPTTAIWVCDKCRSQNAPRDRCFRCKAPRPALAAAAAAAAAAEPGAWREALDTVQRQIYYVNSVTGETSWARPAALGPAPYASGWFGRGSATSASAQAALSERNARWLTRPARKQADVDPSRMQRAEGANEFNIWFGRYVGEHWKGGMGKDPAPSRCDPERDAGRTRASLASIGDRSYFCLHFARGSCARGSECTFLHHIPTAEDDASLDSSRDIFGRARHGSLREDMGGVGSMLSDSRTLYVGGLRRPTTGKGGGAAEGVDPHVLEEEAAAWDAARLAGGGGSGGGSGGRGGGTFRGGFGGAGAGAGGGAHGARGPPPPSSLVAAWEAALQAAFSTWGELENINVIPRLAIAFVRFRCRASAEFALMAMANQSVGQGEVVNLRWAYDDPNPVARESREQADAEAVGAALAARGLAVTLGPQPQPAPLAIAAAAEGEAPEAVTAAAVPVPLKPATSLPPAAAATFSGADAASYLQLSCGAMLNTRAPLPPPLASHFSLPTPASAEAVAAVAAAAAAARAAMAAREAGAAPAPPPPPPPPPPSATGGGGDAAAATAAYAAWYASTATGIVGVGLKRAREE